jgi:hypothetical protein
VDEAIQRQLLDLGIETARVDPVLTNWTRIMEDAAFRRPPFESGKTEKGFRDSLVLEAFDQVRATAPVDPNSCRVVLVSGDALLLESARARFQESANIRLVASVDELRGLINTLVSAVDEDYVNALTPKAQKMFFTQQDTTTLYYSKDVPLSVRERFQGDIGELPNGADSVSLGGATIHPPQFVKKVSQRIYWSSRVEFKLDARKKTTPPNIGDVLADYSKQLTETPTLGSSWLSLGENARSIDWTKIKINNKLLGAPTQPTFEFSSILAQTQTVATGRVAYEVQWSVLVSTARKLSRQQLESVDLGDVRWE